jgi:hypothetical protein
MRFTGFYINLKKRNKIHEKFEESKTDYPEFQLLKRNIMSHTSSRVFGSGPAHTATLTNCYYRRDLPIKSKKYRSCRFNILTYLCYDNITYEPFYLICEDDLYIVNRDYFDKFLKDFDNIKECDNWDVILLTYFGENTYSFDNDEMNRHNFLRNKNNTNTSAYIVRQSMLITIINCLERAMHDQDYNNNLNIFSFKNYWHSLQELNKFYIYNRSFATARTDINEEIIRKI